MTRMSQEWVDEYMQNRQQGAKSRAGDTKPDPGRESSLQKKIVAWAKKEGFPCLSFPQTSKVKRFLPAGYPDITLLLKGRVLFIELKAGKGILRAEQKDFEIKCMYLGHEFYTVRSFKQFLEVIK